MLNTEVLIPYGLHVPSGRMIHVSQARRGMACDCVCAECGTRLISRQGPKNAWCFAHEPSERVCVSAPETSLHKTAKQLLAAAPQVLLPALHPRHPDGRAGQPQAQREQFVDLTETSQEYTGHNGIRPDVYAMTPHGPLIIEVFVAHAVEPRKRERIAALGIPAIEITLDRSSTAWEREAELLALVAEDAPRSWVFHPRQTAIDEALAARLRAAEAARAAAAEADRIAAEARAAAAAAQRRAEEEARAAAYAERMEASRVATSDAEVQLAHYAIDDLVNARHRAASQRWRSLVNEAQGAENEAIAYASAAEARAAREWDAKVRAEAQRRAREAHEARLAEEARIAAERRAQADAQLRQQQADSARYAARKRELAIAAAQSAVTVLEGCCHNIPDGAGALQRARHTLARAMEGQP